MGSSNWIRITGDQHFRPDRLKVTEGTTSTPVAGAEPIAIRVRPAPPSGRPEDSDAALTLLIESVDNLRSAIDGRIEAASLRMWDDLILNVRISFELLLYTARRSDEA